MWQVTLYTYIPDTKVDLGLTDDEVLLTTPHEELADEFIQLFEKEMEALARVDPLPGEEFGDYSYTWLGLRDNKDNAEYGAWLEKAEWKPPELTTKKDDLPGKVHEFVRLRYGEPALEGLLSGRRPNI